MKRRVSAAECVLARRLPAFFLAELLEVTRGPFPPLLAGWLGCGGEGHKAAGRDGGKPLLLSRQGWAGVSWWRGWQ